MPADYRGVIFRSSGDVIVHLDNPRGVTDALQQERISAIQDLNQMRLDHHGDREIVSRMASYELAFRMQSVAPELIDLSGESSRTLEMYGIEDEMASVFGRNCLMAYRMVERGVRFVQLYHYTWDDHGDLNAKLKKIAK